MGAIYKATQEPLGRTVAVKILVPGEGGVDVRGIDRERFFREASVASRLTHPNTVVIHDYGTLEERPGYYLVMEYLDGKTLADVIAEGPMPLDRVVHIATQVCGALSEAHAAEVVHRDLKPQNIMLVDRAGDPYYVKVVDFGLVKMVAPDEERSGEETEEGIIIGSPLYMAPEQIFAGAVDQRTDIYALGVVLYEAICGRPPFIKAGSGGLHQIIVGHTSLRPPPFGEACPGLTVDPKVETVIRKCLEKKAEDRLPTARVLADQLLDATVSLTDTARQRAEATLDWKAGLELKAKMEQLAQSGELETMDFSRDDLLPGPQSSASNKAPTLESRPSEVQPAATSPLGADSVLPLGQPATAASAVSAAPKEESDGGFKPVWAVAALVVLLVVGVVAWAPWAKDGATGEAGATVKASEASAKPTPKPTPRKTEDAATSTPAPAAKADATTPPASAKDAATGSLFADASVIVTVDCQPPAMVVDLMGKHLGETPRPIAYKKSELPKTLRCKRPGYADAEKRITPDMVGDKATLTVKLGLEKLQDKPAVPDAAASPGPDASPAVATPDPEPATPKKKKKKKKKKSGGGAGIKLVR